MSQDQQEAFVERFTRGWAGGRDALAAEMEGHVAPDVLLTQPLAPPARGLRGFDAQFKRLFGLIPDLTGEVHRWEPTEDGVTIDMTFHGTLLGRAFELPNRDRIVLRDGLLAERHADFRPLSLLPDLHRVAAAAALTVGAGAAVAPGPLMRAYGAREPITGTGALGWRLFAARTLYIGARAWRGDDAARASIVPIQLLDQIAFAHAGLTGAIPRRTWTAAALTSAGLIALCRAPTS